MRPLRLLPTLLLLGAAALASVTLAPTASAACVPRGDGQDLVCARPVGHPTGTCLSYFVNPPLPGTSVGGFVCQPVAICHQQPAGCVTNFCLMVPRPTCWHIVLETAALDQVAGAEGAGAAAGADAAGAP